MAKDVIHPGSDHVFSLQGGDEIVLSASPSVASGDDGEDENEDDEDGDQDDDEEDDRDEVVEEEIDGA